MRGIAASWVVTGEADTPPIRDGALVVDDGGAIVAVDRGETLRAKCPDARWEVHRAVLLPGLVNAHTHLELSMLRGLVPGGRGFAPWVETMLAARDRTAPRARAEAIRAAVDELVASGTVAVGEVTNTLDTVDALAASPLSGCVFHEVFGPSRAAAQERLADAARRRAEIDRWPSAFTYAPAAHTPFTVPPDIVRDIVSRARALGARTSLHLCEHAAERAYLWDGTGPVAAAFARLASPIDWAPPGKDPVSYVAELGALGPEMLCVHLTDAREREIETVAAAGTRVVLCPRSNLHIEVRLPPLGSILGAGIRPALGTDSLASAPSLDVLEEARALHARFPSVPPRTLLAMATHWGAEALGLGARLGRLASGLAPGVVAFEHDGAAPEDPERWLLSHGPRSRRVLCPPRSERAGRGAA